MKWLDKYQDGGQVFNARQKRGIDLQIKDYKQQQLDKKELQTKGTINNPKSIKYKNLAPKKEEVRSYIPQSTTSKAWEVATHPMTAAGYVARNESLPDNFSKGEINAHETATNLINPFFYADESKNFVKNVVTGHPLDAGINALNVLPLASEYKALGNLANKTGKLLGTEKGLLSNTHKINPWAFKPQQGKIYRQVGKPGFDDALMEGKVYDKGQKQFLQDNPNINYLDEYNEAINAKGLYLKKPSSAPFFSKDELFFPINRKATGKGFKKTANSDAEYLIEGSVPDEALLPRYMDKYLKPGEINNANTFVLRPEYNNLENFKTYKRDWLQGYKQVEAPKSNFKSEIDWAKWNKEIPDNLQLMKEYSAIEKTTKANGSWMKNPDGSEFRGTPEQFVQQNSENFKKAFGNSKLLNPDGSPTIQYHGSAKKFDTFDESKFQLGDAGYSGSGIYTTPNKTKASSYSLSSKSIHKDGNLEPTIYELYGKGNNPISAEELIKQKKDYDLFNFHRAKDWQGDVPLERQMREYDVAIRNQTRGVERISPWNDADELVFPTNKQLKSAIGNNGMFDMTNPNIYKSVLPIGLGLGAASQLEQKKNGGIIKDDNGYWNPKNWGKTVEINSPDITMEGVNQPLLGTSKQTGEKRIMFPGENHKFANTKQVIETPLKGKWLNKYN